eukprot:COSAG02_NODE_8509_length_2543_cov_2.043372_1_plen_337_part_00
MAAHRFSISPELGHAIESRRIDGRWTVPRGIVDHNDAISVAQGFELPDGGGWQAVPPLPRAELVRCTAEAPESGGAGPCLDSELFDKTEVCVAHCDTVSAALALGDASALNFANAEVPGGGYRRGSRAQEEDLCRLLPQLYPSLLGARDTGAYPLPPDSALLTRGVMAVRQLGSYEPCACLGDLTVVTAAMPVVRYGEPSGGWLSENGWSKTVRLRVRAVLHAAALSGHPNLVLGAFGCGAFGNPAEPVAAIFREQLQSAEFRGRFQRVVFAIIDPLGTGNLQPFRQQMQTIEVIEDVEAPAACDFLAQDSQQEPEPEPELELAADAVAGRRTLAT